MVLQEHTCTFLQSAAYILLLRGRVALATTHVIVNNTYVRMQNLYVPLYYWISSFKAAYPVVQWCINITPSDNIHPVTATKTPPRRMHGTSDCHGLPLKKKIWITQGGLSLYFSLFLSVCCSSSSCCFSSSFCSPLDIDDNNYDNNVSMEEVLLILVLYSVVTGSL